MIGPRIKSARRLRNMTLKELAASSGTSEGHMSKIENGKTDASLALLHRITQTLGVNLDVFFDEPDEMERSVSRAGTRPVLEIDRGRQGTGISLERVIPCTPDHMLQCNIHIVEPGGSSDGQIDHIGEEMGFVLEGQIELILTDETFLLG
ncbi:helix-turn-helix domain-containing protein, partial [Roseovarius sp. D0-M9]|uniref:helix-turn-helix domain-containing protein n=1 Tax=Roseovarius sp. D0-M9 TaxID=3127117 RepID=UPI00301011BB